ncbi:MAG: hypothetical protein KDK64_03730 [Chlamydiia bacterium]|nr:hypothetical protein [Chlamydiia bacterium]
MATKLQILGQELNQMVDQAAAKAMSYSPVRPNDTVKEGLGIIICVASGYFSYRNSPTLYFSSAAIGFAASMRDIPKYPLEHSLKEEALLSPWAKDGMTYQKALLVLWVLGGNWEVAKGFLAGHMAYHCTKAYVDAACDEVKKHLKSDVE